MYCLKSFIQWILRYHVTFINSALHLHFNSCRISDASWPITLIMEHLSYTYVIKNIYVYNIYFLSPGVAFTRLLSKKFQVPTLSRADPPNRESEAILLFLPAKIRSSTFPLYPLAEAQGTVTGLTRLGLNVIL